MYFSLNIRNLKLFKQHIAFLSILVLSIPTILQTIHIFETHDEHFVCNSDVDQHFHEYENIDCSLLHFQFEIFSTDLTSQYDVIPVHFYTNTFNEQPQITNVVHAIKNTNRGPPAA